MRGSGGLYHDLPRGAPGQALGRISSMPSTILLSAASTPAHPTVGRNGGVFGPGRRLHCANPRHLVPGLAARFGAPPPSAHQLPHTCAFFYRYLCDRRYRRRLPAHAQAKAGRTGPRRAYRLHGRPADRRHRQPVCSRRDHARMAHLPHYRDLSGGIHQHH